MATDFNRQIHELSVRTNAYLDKCRSLWTRTPTPPHYGAPFLFSFVWAGWQPSQRRALVEQGRTSVEQSIAQMMSQSGAAPQDTPRMQLLLAACVPELFQDELHEELRPMANLLSTLWGQSAGASRGKEEKARARAERAAARASRPKHASSEMGFIDELPWVWSQPTLQLIEHTLHELDYAVFDPPRDAAAAAAATSAGRLSPADNELFQRDLLLSLRAFWMSYFGLQVFMALSDHFATTEAALLAQARAAAQTHGQAAQAQAQEKPHVAQGPGYSKPIHTFKLEDLPLAAGNGSTATVTELPSGPASSYCACCLRSSADDAAATSTDAAASPAPLDLKRCARCKSVWYCSVDCQRKHFKSHKVECATIAAEATAAAATGSPPTAATTINTATPAAVDPPASNSCTEVD